jgi:tight adherence protein B
MRRAFWIVAAVFLVAGVPAASAGAPRLVPTGAATYPERSYLLSLPAARALGPGQVRVRENGIPVRGLQILRAGTSAQSRSAVVIMIDESLTMKGTAIHDAFAAARTFAARANSDEEIAIITFNHTVSVLEPFSSSASAIAAALGRPPTLEYGTKNYNALEQAGALITGAHVASGSIIILTDGQNVGSTVTPKAALNSLGASRIRVFAVGLPSPAYNPSALRQMASLTDGAYIKATSLSQLSPILGSIGSRLSSEYLLRYRSVANPSTHVTVAVSVQGEPAVANATYVSPPLDLVSAPAPQKSEFSKIIVSPVVMVLVVIVFVSLLLFALANAFTEHNAPLLSRVGGFVSVGSDAQPAEPTPRASRRSGPAPTRGGLLARVQRAEESRRWSVRLGATLELADIAATPFQVVLLTVGSALVVGFILYVAIGILGAIIAVVVVPFAARWLVLRKLRRKRRAFAEQLPDNLDVLASSLRAGHSLVGALAVVAEDASEPSKGEYRRVVAEEQLGVQLEDALKVTAMRMDNRDIEQVALVARLQREMGSNSAEVLDRVIDTVRSRMELRRLVRTLTAQGRLSRWILTGLPVGLALVLTLLDRHYMHPLFHSLLGKALIVGSVCMVALGSFIIGKIIDIKA